MAEPRPPFESSPLFAENLLVRDGLILRIPDYLDITRLAELANRNQADLQEWFPWAKEPMDKSTAEAYIRLRRQWWQSGEALPFFIDLDGQIVGAVSAMFNWENNRVSVGYWLDIEARGRGIAEEAIGRFVDYCFSDLDIHRIELDIATTNINSAKLAQGLGFTNEGVRKEHWLSADGSKYHDMAIYRLLQSEWAEARS